MAATPLPEHVRRFVLTCIPSVPHLEAALFFRGCAAESHSMQDAARALYLTESSAQTLLETLVTAGLLRREGEQYRYAPRDDELATAMEDVARAYHTDLIGLTNLIHNTTQRSAQRFANAFKWRKDP